jgi:sporulation protein YlmC with PRC-barrel domain
MRPVAAEQLEGGRVVTREGETLGTIEDVMVDLQSGTIAYAVLEAADAGRYAVPWAALKPMHDGATFVVEGAAEISSAAMLQRGWPELP